MLCAHAGTAHAIARQKATAKDVAANAACQNLPAAAKRAIFFMRRSDPHDIGRFALVGRAPPNFQNMLAQSVIDVRVWPELNKQPGQRHEFERGRAIADKLQF
jgi:hypothetical protein